MAYGVPPKSELDEAVYLAWLDKHPPVLDQNISWSAGGLQSEYSSTLSISRAIEIVQEWRNINWTADTQFDNRGFIMGSEMQLAWEAYDKEQGGKS
tara:strand:+ start:6966 stop:7253 length:288 start_codon:yes stop_codon:yes gene_type:complete